LELVVMDFCLSFVLLGLISQEDKTNCQLIHPKHFRKLSTIKNLEASIYIWFDLLDLIVLGIKVIPKKLQILQNTTKIPQLLVEKSKSKTKYNHKRRINLNFQWISEMDNGPGYYKTIYLVVLEDGTINSFTAEVC